MLKTQLTKRGHMVRTYSYTEVLAPAVFSEVDVVHANHLHKGTLACVFQSAAPTVYTSHDGFVASGLLAHEYSSEPAYMRMIKNTARNLVLAYADVVVALSAQEADQLHSLGVPKDRLTVVPNGLDGGDYHQPERLSSVPRRYPFRILFVGQILLWIKGLDILVQAMARLVEKGCDIELIVATHNFRELGTLETLISRVNLTERVVIIGPLSRDDLVAEYWSCELVVLPSHVEALPTVILEAMWCGRAVVSTSVGGVPTVLAGTANRMVESGNPEELAKAIEYFVTHQSDLGAIGADNVKHVSEKFSMEKMVSAYEALYDNAVRRRTGRLIRPILYGTLRIGGT